ncbi:MAG TPA: carbon monoxide dehydrogenase, partial [Tepidanaerobacteraceae bacterium]|nr:carbon monoxide dehydrogenase [Tepidanaerobacteraceae bacterium]
NQEEREFLIKACEDVELLGFLSYDPELIEADRQGQTPFKRCILYTQQVEAIKDNILKLLDN